MLYFSVYGKGFHLLKIKKVGIWGEEILPSFDTLQRLSRNMCYLPNAILQKDHSNDTAQSCQQHQYFSVYID